MFTLVKLIGIVFFLCSQFFGFIQSFRIFGYNICSAIGKAHAASCMVWCIPTKFVHSIFIGKIWSKFLIFGPHLPNKYTVYEFGTHQTIYNAALASRTTEQIL